jgi:hypothetical protein
MKNRIQPSNDSSLESAMPSQPPESLKNDGGLEIKSPDVGHWGWREAAIALLIGRCTLTETALALGIDRRTLYRWRMRDPEFERELNRRRAEVLGKSADRLQPLLQTALDTLPKQLLGSSAPRSNRAARTLLSLARVGMLIAELSSTPPPPSAGDSAAR